MFAKPQSEHEWLQQLVGDWMFEHDCIMPDGSSSKTPGKMNCRTLGGLWLICESSGGEGTEDPWSAIMTIGYDPAQSQYVGTFVGSMMANIWPYHGQLDASGKRLPLNSTGPKMDGTGTANYRDTIEIIDENTWRFTSEMEDGAGGWIKFMEGLHNRCES